MILGIVLAAGKGKRINSKRKNKTARVIEGKPIIKYGAEVFQKVCNSTVVVTGYLSKSVENALKGENVTFIHQKEQLGTGHAVKTVIDELGDSINDYDNVLVGNGDNLIFHSEELIKELLDEHRQTDSVATVLSLLSSEDLNSKDNGRIIRSKSGNLIDIIEFKQATIEQRKIGELNTGFYCFNRKFLVENILNLSTDSFLGEVKLTDLIRIARKQDLNIHAMAVAHPYLGLGVNTSSQLDRIRRILKSQKISSASNVHL